MLEISTMTINIFIPPLRNFCYKDFAAVVNNNVIIKSFSELVFHV